MRNVRDVQGGRRCPLGMLRTLRTLFSGFVGGGTQRPRHCALKGGAAEAVFAHVAAPVGALIDLMAGQHGSRRLGRITPLRAKANVHAVVFKLYRRQLRPAVHRAHL